MSSDWKKMKVQALRDELANHGLETSGVKSTLIERLENFAANSVDGSAGKTDGDKKDAEVLEEGEAEPEVAEKPEILKEAIAVSLEPEVVAKESPVGGDIETAKPLDLNGPAVVAPLTDIEKKQRRAERFGTDLKISEAEKRKLRAARFNGGSTNGASTVTAKEGVSGPSSAIPDAEAAKRKLRAERFGTATATTTESSGKFKFSADEEAKKKARMARFATPAK